MSLAWPQQLPVTGLSSLTAIRYKEIEQFLKEQEVFGEWLALDDDPSLFPPNCLQLLLCEMGLGCAEEHALRRALSKARDS